MHQIPSSRRALIARLLSLVRICPPRHLSRKKFTCGAGLSAFHILQHEADQWSRIRATSVIDTNMCIGIKVSFLKVTSFKAAKQFIGNKKKG